jgi:lysophospholipase L1-like esterase
MSRLNLSKLLLFSLIFALVFYTGAASAIASGDAILSEDDLVSYSAYSYNGDVDYYDSSKSAESFPLYTRNPEYGPEDETEPEDDYSPPDDYNGGTSSGEYLVSTIGDSYMDNSHIRGVFSDRLQGDYAFRSIPGTSTVNFHGYAGQRLGSIYSRANGDNVGYSEGADFVLIQGGTNDINLDRDVGLDELVDRMIDDLQRIIDIVYDGNYDPNTRPAIIVSAIPPMLDPSLTDKSQALAERIINSLDKVDIFTTANFWELYDAGSDAANSIYMQDNIHTNDDGSYRVAENWFEAIDALYDPTRIENDPYIYTGNWYFDRSGSAAVY